MIDREGQRAVTKAEAAEMLHAAAFTTDESDHEKLRTLAEWLAGASPVSFRDPIEVVTRAREALGKPRRIVHSMAGMIGADWDLDDALTLVESAEAILLVNNPFRHNLAVQTDDRVLFFDVG